MKSTPLTAVLAGVLALSAGASAFAQPYSTDPAAEQRYEDRQQDYRESQSDYAAKQADYQARQEEYQRQQGAYEAQRADYERARAAYDRRYGYGSYVRRYGSFETRYPAPSAYDYSRNTSYSDYYAGYRDTPCERRRSNNTTAGGIIGALAGAAIGSNVAAGGVRTEGAVLGAVVGGVAGASIGRSTAKCDDTGYWYSYDQTVPYRESAYDRRNRSGRYDYSYYSRSRCRLAVAPASYGDSTDYRYVRVCPDGRGRYRITG